MCTQVSEALKESLSGAASADEEPGLRVQLARTIGLVFAPSGWQKQPDEGKVPGDSLELEHVHGYNGEQPGCLHINADGLVVYMVAAAGVVHDVAANKQRFFCGHNEDILCLARHPERKLMASAQMDPKGAETPFTCVWDSSTEPPTQVVEGSAGGEGRGRGSVALGCLWLVEEWCL